MTFLQWRLNIPPWQPIGVSLEGYISDAEPEPYYATLGPMSYSLIKGDLEPDMTLTASVNGVAENLTGVLSHNMRWKKPNGTISTVAMTAVNLPLGQVKRVWVAGDTDVVGAHLGQLVVVRSNGETQTFPNDQSFYVWHVYDQLAAS